jgi:AmmeMemoRadiSam system protein B
MVKFLAVAALLAVVPLASAAPPTLEETRRQMGIPSTDAVRGQLDTVGYASTPEAMAKVWELSAQGPPPESFGEGAPRSGVVGVIGPHDDYIYAARVYRRVFPLVTAKTVVVVGVFHKYRRYEARDQLVFDTYRAWRAPDGEIPVSSLRDELVAAMPAGMAVQDAAAHDAEHSIEGIAYFLKHARPDLEIVPVIVPAASFERLSALSASLGGALAASMRKRGWQLGRDVAIVVSTDGVHYGDDFKHVPYGAGGVDAFMKALAFDRALVRETLAGPFTAAQPRKFFETVVDAKNPDTYRVPWCGRFSVPVGAMLIDATARALGLSAPRAVPIALGVSVDQPELAIRGVGLGPTAPANLYHFVTHPAIAYTAE